MIIHTEYIRFENSWMVSSCDDIQGHQQCFLRSCCFSRTASQWLEVLWGLVLAHPGAFLLLVSSSTVVTGNTRCSLACYWCFQVLSGLSLVLLGAHLIVYRPSISTSICPWCPRCIWKSLQQTSTLWNLTTPGFWSDNFQKLPETKI